MGRKQYLFLGLAVVLVGLAVAVGMLWTKAGGLVGMADQKQTDSTTENKSEAKVVSWQPETATGM